VKLALVLLSFTLLILLLILLSLLPVDSQSVNLTWNLLLKDHLNKNKNDKEHKVLKIPSELI